MSRVTIIEGIIKIYIFSDDSRQQSDDYGSLPSWDDASGFGGQYDDESVHSDIEASSTLVSQPRQVGFHPNAAYFCFSK